MSARAATSRSASPRPSPCCSHDGTVRRMTEEALPRSCRDGSPTSSTSTRSAQGRHSTSSGPGTTPGWPGCATPSGWVDSASPARCRPPSTTPSLPPARPDNNPQAQRHRAGHGRAHHPRLRHRRAAAPIPAAAVDRRGDLVPAVLRARRRLRPRRRQHPRGQGRGRVGRQRAEGVDVERAQRRLGDPARPHRPRRRPSMPDSPTSWRP